MRNLRVKAFRPSAFARSRLAMSSVRRTISTEQKKEKEFRRFSIRKSTQRTFVFQMIDVKLNDSSNCTIISIVWRFVCFSKNKSISRRNEEKCCFDLSDEINLLNSLIKTKNFRSGTAIILRIRL